MNLQKHFLGSSIKLSDNVKIATSAIGPDFAPKLQNASVLSRSVCRFSTFTPPASLTKQEAAKAAWLFAEARAPFANSKYLLLDRGEHFEIWHWDDAEDAASRAPRFGPEKQCVPETLLQAPGDGWRQVQLQSGFEAQYWSNGKLRASVWRRHAFSQEQWRMFALSVPDGASTPLETPGPMAVRMEPQTYWRQGLMQRDPEWKMIERIGIGITACGLIAAAFLSGEALRLSMAAQQHHIPAITAPQGEIQHALDDLKSLQLLGQSAKRRDILMSVVRAKNIAHAFGAEPSAWRVDAKGVEFEFESGSVGGTPDSLAAAYELSKEFKDVVPEYRSDGGLKIRAQLERAS